MMDNQTRLPRTFYARDTRLVALELIGKVLVFKEAGSVCTAQIVETEAYLGDDDPASHAYRRKTPRNAVMFGPPGFSYVYFTYGVHHCFNVVTEEEGKAGAVLLRAVEPLEGIHVMQKRRRTTQLENLTSGPGKLAEAFGLTRAHSGWDLTGSSLWLEQRKEAVDLELGVTPRIGIREAKDRLYRFYLKNSLHISR